MPKTSKIQTCFGYTPHSIHQFSLPSTHTCNTYRPLHNTGKRRRGSTNMTTTRAIYHRKCKNCSAFGGCILLMAVFFCFLNGITSILTIIADKSDIQETCAKTQFPRARAGIHLSHLKEITLEFSFSIAKLYMY